VLFNGRRFGQIERLALGHALNDIDQDHIAEFFFRQPLGRGGAYVSGPYNRYFLVHHILLWLFCLQNTGVANQIETINNFFFIRL